MNFESEAAVHLFLEEQSSAQNENEVQLLDLTAVEDEGRFVPSRKTRSAKERKAGAFGDLLTKTSYEGENVPDDSFTKLEDMFPEETARLYREKYFENPMLCDGPVVENNDREAKLMRLKALAGSFSNFVSLLSSTGKENQAEEQSTDVTQRRSPNDKDLPRPSLVKSKSKSFGAKKVSWDENTFVNEDNPQTPPESSTPTLKLKLSFSNLKQLLRAPSFGRRAEIVRDPGSKLSEPRPKGILRRESTESQRKSSKTSLLSDDSRASFGSRLFKYFST